MGSFLLVRVCIERVLISLSEKHPFSPVWGVNHSMNPVCLKPGSQVEKASNPSISLPHVLENSIAYGGHLLCVLPGRLPYLAALCGVDLVDVALVGRRGPGLKF